MPVPRKSTRHPDAFSLSLFTNVAPCHRSYRFKINRLYLCETENVDAIVIAPDVEAPDVVEAQMRRITIKLKPEATAKELIWQLLNLFPDKTTTVQ